MESKTVGVHEAKTQLSDLLRQVEAGGTVIITRRGTPVAELRAAPTAQRRPLGLLAGQWDITPEEIERVFTGRDEEIERDFYGGAYDDVVEAAERLGREREA